LPEAISRLGPIVLLFICPVGRSKRMNKNVQRAGTGDDTARHVTYADRPRKDFQEFIELIVDGINRVEKRV